MSRKAKIGSTPKYGIRWSRIIAAILVLVVAGMGVRSYIASDDTPVDPAAAAVNAREKVDDVIRLEGIEFVAVRLSSGELYFGKLGKDAFEREGFVRIHEAYQATTETSDAIDVLDADLDVQLVRVSKRFYEGSGELVLPKETILSVEYLSPDSKVVEALANTAY